MATLPSGNAGLFLSEWREEIVYKPSGGDARSIFAIVDRDPPEPLAGAPHGIAPLMTITVSNEAVTGISSGEVDTGGDLVTVAFLIGSDADDHAVTRILKHDDDMMTLELR